MTSELAPGVITTLSLYDIGGENLLASSTSSGGPGSVISWTPTFSGTYYLQASSAISEKVGCLCNYELGITSSCTLNSDYLVVPSTGATVVPGSSYVSGSTCNNCTVQVNLPFSYSFYDTTYSQANVSNKGVVQFTSNNVEGSNTCRPSGTFNDAIFVYWDNHNTNINDTMGIYTSTTGTAPNRIFNIEWRAGYEANDVRSNFEVRLYEGLPKFELIYGQTRRGFSATVGVQNANGTRSTQYSCNTNNSIPLGTRLTFDRKACSSLQIGKK